MKFQVTGIEFNFEEEDGIYPSRGYQEELECEVKTTIWNADDEDDLVEEITCATGYCIGNIDFVHVLS